jgi:hypothetical protein
MTTLIALAALLAQEKPDLEKTKLFVYDATKEMTLKVMKDGSVELTVVEEDSDTGKKSSRTLGAPSLEEFRRKNPEVVRKYDLDRYTGARRSAIPDDFDQLFREFRRGIPEMPPMPRFDPFEGGDLDKWLDEQLRRRFRRPGEPAPAPAPPAPVPAPAPGGLEFGIKVDPVEETLRDQFSLKEGEGVMVGEVKPGSTAEKAGVKKHDVILKLDGKAVGDTWGFRKDVLRALAEKPEFDLEILRSGKRQTLKVKP